MKRGKTRQLPISAGIYLNIAMFLTKHVISQKNHYKIEKCLENTLASTFRGDHSIHIKLEF